MTNPIDDQMPDQDMEKPVTPLQWDWIVQRGNSGNNSTANWKFGFIGSDGAEIRVTFHETSDKPSEDQATVPEGQPGMHQPENGTYYVIFFSNRSPVFAKYDVSLSHEDSMQMWVTITRGIIDFLQKAKPQVIILDDLGNGKLKMVLRSVCLDCVEASSEYEFEQTKQNLYKTFYQVKKKGLPSAFQDAIQGTSAEGENVIPSASETPDTSNGANPSGGTDEPNTPAPIADKSPSTTGVKAEIGRDFSITIRNHEGLAIDRYQAKNATDLLRFMKKKGYTKLKMKIVSKSQPTVVSEPAPVKESFEIIGSSILVHEPLSPNQAALINQIVNAEKVFCVENKIGFAFATSKRMHFKKTMIEVAYNEITNKSV